MGGVDEADAATPGVAHPVHRLVGANRVQNRACGLGAVVERVPPARVPAGAVSWAGDDDQAALRGQLVLHPAPGPFVNEQAVPQHRGRPLPNHPDGQRTHLRLHRVSLFHNRNLLLSHIDVVDSVNWYHEHRR